MKQYRSMGVQSGFIIVEKKEKRERERKRFLFKLLKQYYSFVTF